MHTRIVFYFFNTKAPLKEFTMYIFLFLILTQMIAVTAMESDNPETYKRKSEEQSLMELLPGQGLGKKLKVQSSNLANTDNEEDMKNLLRGYFNSQDRKSSTTPLIKSLLKNNSGSINIKNLIDTFKIDGNNPLHIAIMQGRLKLVEYFIDEYYADTTIKNNEGMTPLEIAKQYKSRNSSTGKRISLLLKKVTKENEETALSLLSLQIGPFPFGNSVSSKGITQ